MTDKNSRAHSDCPSVGGQGGELQALRAVDCGASSADLIVLPEMFSTGFSMNSALLAEPVSGETVDLAPRLCQRLLAAPYRQFYRRRGWSNISIEGFGSRLTASPEFYDKRHLFRMSGEHEHYSPGSAFKIFSIGRRVCLQICYDLRFPAFSKVKRTATIFFVFFRQLACARRTQWRALLQARAIENQCVVVGVNRVEDGQRDAVFR